MVFIPTAKYVCSKRNFAPYFSDTGYVVHIYRTVNKEWVHVVR